MIPRRGTPMAEANFAAESKIAVAKLRSPTGNQAPIAFAFAGNVGASPTPSKNRAPKNPPSPGVSAAQNEPTLHRNVLTTPTRRIPNLSSNTPTGNWHIAYVQL